MQGRQLILNPQLPIDELQQIVSNPLARVPGNHLLGNGLGFLEFASFYIEVRQGIQKVKTVRVKAVGLQEGCFSGFIFSQILQQQSEVIMDARMVW